MRKTPQRFAELYQIAKAAKLDCPRGRALYACNRIANGGFNYMDPLDTLSRCRTATAKQWLEHWMSGGSIKFATLSHVEANAKRRVYDRIYRARLRANGFVKTKRGWELKEGD
jgi:hypothetical protein